MTQLNDKQIEQKLKFIEEYIYSSNAAEGLRIIVFFSLSA
jgi:hypothetical protein